MRLRRTALVLLTAGTLVIPAVGASAQDPVEPRGIGIRLVDDPSSRPEGVRAQRYIVEHAPPGATVRRLVEVVNHEDRPLAVRVYAAGATISDATFRPSDSEDEDDIARWTALDSSSFELAPGRSRRVTATISVPDDAAEGERYGAIWAELPAAEPASGPAVVNRVGIRVYLSVGEGGEPASDFVVDSLTAKREADGAPVVTAQVHNTGGRALDLSGELVLDEGPSRLSAGPFPASLGTTLGIGESGDVRVELDRELPAGPWEATLTLRSGTLERTARATITFPDEAGESAAPVAAERVTDSGGGRVLVAVGVFLVLAVLGLLGWYLLERSRH